MELFWEAFKEIWEVGRLSGWWFLGTLIAVLYIIQTLWLLWRWIDDAEDREESEPDYVSKEKRRRVFCGDLFDIEWLDSIEWLGSWSVQRHETAEFYVHTIAIIGVGGGLAIAAWPFVLIFGTMYGLLRAARGSRRLQKTVSRMAVTFKNKSDIDHNHDELHVQK